MYDHNQFNKEAVVKKVFGAAAVTILGLSLFLGKPCALDKKNFTLATVVNAKETNPSSEGTITDKAGALLVNHANPISTQTIAPQKDPSVTVDDRNITLNLPDFAHAAKVATPAVVHIRARQEAKTIKHPLNNPLDQLFKEFFGDSLRVNPREYEKPSQEFSGSGVIYTADGYIVTNNHLVEGADHIEVNLNDNRRYVAKLIGTDPVIDLAVLKIEEKNLPVLALGSSDKLEVGEWVLAVGNPFNLTSTVTKGIVSAKSRVIGGGEEGKLSIQSFIQTDAFINQGNSGGALVNLYGELVGINTAIYASRSASFMGYGFAIPSSLVKKVANDLIQYGVVQRVLLGVTISNVNAELAKKLGLKKIAGVYINSVQENSPCAKLLQKEDVITHINGRQTDKTSELQEIIACAKPGDKVAIQLYRKSKEKTVEVVLEKNPDEVRIVQKNETLQAEGTVFQNVDEKTREKLKLTHGVLIKEVIKGKFQAAGLKKGHILISFDKQPVKNIMCLAEMIRNTKGPVLLGITEPSSGTVSYLAVDLGN